MTAPKRRVLYIYVCIGGEEEYKKEKSQWSFDAS